MKCTLKLPTTAQNKFFGVIQDYIGYMTLARFYVKKKILEFCQNPYIFYATVYIFSHALNTLNYLYS